MAYSNQFWCVCVKEKERILNRKSATSNFMLCPANEIHIDYWNYLWFLPLSVKKRKESTLIIYIRRERKRIQKRAIRNVIIAGKKSIEPNVCHAHKHNRNQTEHYFEWIFLELSRMHITIAWWTGGILRCAKWMNVCCNIAKSNYISSQIKIQLFFLPEKKSSQ